MIDILRRKRNRDELAKMHPVYAHLFEAVVAAMEAGGGRPRLQDAARTNAQQQQFFMEGKSQVKFSGPHTMRLFGKPASLAVHVLDDNAPLKPSPAWIARLAVAAQINRLQTGCAWAASAASALAPDKPARLVLEAAIAAADLPLVTKLLTEGEIGFDPLHVEVPAWHTIMRGDS